MRCAGGGHPRHAAGPNITPMPRFVALLRGVSPLNASMPALKRCFERAGFEGVKTLLATDPFAPFAFPPQAKRVVSFLRDARPPRLPLPLTEGFATVACQHGLHVFTAYIPGDEGPVFMKLIERAFGTDVTTRTWDTVSKCAVA